MFKEKYIGKDKLIFYCYLCDLWKDKLFQDKTALPKGYRYLKKITLGSRKMKSDWLWKITSLLRIHLSIFFGRNTAFEKAIHIFCPKLLLYALCEDVFDIEAF